MSKTTKDRGVGKDGFVEFYRYNIAIACQLGIKLCNPVMLYGFYVFTFDLCRIFFLLSFYIFISCCQQRLQPYVHELQQILCFRSVYIYSSVELTLHVVDNMT